MNDSPLGCSTEAMDTLNRRIRVLLASEYCVVKEIGEAIDEYLTDPSADGLCDCFISIVESLENGVSEYEDKVDAAERYESLVDAVRSAISDMENYL